MPAIHLFRRRTLFGGDDLQPAAFITACLRCLQLTLFLGPIWAHIALESAKAGGLYQYMFDASNSEDASCRYSNLFALFLVLYATASTIFCCSTMLLEYKIAHWSSQGCPTQTEPRSSHVRQLLEYKLVPFSVALFLIWMTGMSALAMKPLYNRCTTSSSDKEALFSHQQAQDVALRILLGDQEGDEDISSDGSRLRYWWIAYGLLLVTQIAEVIAAWTFLIHLYRQPVIDDSIEEGESWMEGSTFVSVHNHELMEEMWADACANACQCLSSSTCFLFGGRELLGQAEFGDVARALADYLETRGVLDVVPSDIVTGFVVLQRLQKQRIYQSRQVVLQNLMKANSIEEGDTRRTPQNGPVEETPIVAAAIGGELDLLTPLEGTDSSNNDSNTSSRSQQSVYRLDPSGDSYERQSRALLSRVNFMDMTILEEGARYAKYSLAIYTWVLYLYVHPLTGVPRLLTHSRCHGCTRRHRSHLGVASLSLSDGLVDEQGRIIGDNICETHKAALLLTAGLSESDLVYAQLKSSFNEIPYCILLDRRWKSVVLVIRGTFSLEDCVTDVLIDPEPLEKLGQDFGFDATGQHCHGGVLACVRSVYGDLERHGLLDRLLLGDHARYPDYTLRLVGHSLGAATCTLLSFMLRSKFPTLRCVNYSPPGCSLTWEMATECKAWCTSFVLDADLVPRLSVASMEHLRDEILELIGRIKVPKVEVAARVVHGSGLWGCRLCNESELEDQEQLLENIEDMLYDETELPDSTYRRQLNRFKVIQEERRQARGAIRSIKMYPPGKMVHLVKTGEHRNCLHGMAKCLTCCATNIGFHYTPMWVDNDDFNEIVVSPTMGTDHFPNRIALMLERVAKDFGLDPS